MDELLKRAAEQVPALAVLAVLGMLGVRAVLAYLAERERLFSEVLAKRDETLTSIGNNCHAVQRRSSEALLENSRALGENAKALVEVRNVLEKLNGGK